jgi:hypothetical protein
VANDQMTQVRLVGSEAISVTQVERNLESQITLALLGDYGRICHERRYVRVRVTSLSPDDSTRHIMSIALC